MASPKASVYPQMNAENVTMARGAGSAASMGLLALGLLGVAATVGGAFVVGSRHAMASWQAASMAVLAIGLGGLFFTMVMHLTNAGWSSTIRRQWENMAALLPVLALMAFAVPAIDFLVAKGELYTWMNSKFSGDIVLSAKAPYLNGSRFFLFGAIYIIVWAVLSRAMNMYSRTQDVTGDRMLSARARFTSSWGMLIFALTLAFAAFDWMMSADFRFFSTMWGVYYFAGAAFSASATCALVLTFLLRAGKLKGVVTEEHFHDLGKLMFSFTVFWSYIAFSQYFLIWYSNIPEETAWFIARKAGGWKLVFQLLCIGHFVLPFLVLIFRKVKRTPAMLSLVAVWMLAMQVVDMIFIMRPMVYANVAPESIPGPASWWVDAAAIVGAFGIFFGLLIRKVCSTPLVPLQDPRLGEALKHKNYV